MRIGIGNAEQVLFYDAEAWKHLPDLTQFRNQWSFSKTSPHLKPTGLRAIMDFLAAAGRTHEEALSSYFGEPVTIDKFDPSPVKNVEFKIDENPDLDGFSRYTGFSVYRDGEKASVTFWR